MLVTLLASQFDTSAEADPTIVQDRWAVIEDINKDRLRVETTDDKVWTTLVQLYQNGSERWIGGIVESYINEWGFRFNPDTILVAVITIEVWQTTVRGISQNLGYWLGNMAVVGAKVVEIHPPVTYDATIDAYCYFETAHVSVALMMDGAPTGYNTPHTFTGLTGSHTFTVPNIDIEGDPFNRWSTGNTSTTITVSSGGTYTAYFGIRGRGGGAGRTRR